MPIASASSNLAISIGGINLSIGQHILNINIKAASSGTSPFDSIRRVEEGKEFWLARELMPMLGYTKWGRFGAKQSDQVSAICRAIISCNTSGNVVKDNFTHFPKQGNSVDSMFSDMTPEDWRLSRFACYLVAMNGDVTKPEIAAAQSYFVVKTREAEIASKKQPADLSSSECGMLIGSAIESCIDAKLAKKLELIFSYFHGMQATIDRQQAEMQQLKQIVQLAESRRGQPRSGEEIRMAIKKVLDDPALGNLPNTQIAVICDCSESMVRKFKGELEGKFSDDDDNSLEIQLKVKIPNPWKK